MWCVSSDLEGHRDGVTSPCTALSLLGNRLAPRLHTSPLRWPRTQNENEGWDGQTQLSGALICKSTGLVYYQAFEPVVTLSFFFSMAIFWAVCHGSPHSLSLKDAVYWYCVMSMHRFAELLGPIQSWSLIWKKMKETIGVCECVWGPRASGTLRQWLISESEELQLLVEKDE